MQLKYTLKHWKSTFSYLRSGLGFGEVRFSLLGHGLVRFSLLGMDG